MTTSGSPFYTSCIKKKLLDFLFRKLAGLKIYFTFAQQIKTITMLRTIHINSAKCFSPVGYSGAGLIMYHALY